MPKPLRCRFCEHTAEEGSILCRYHRWWFEEERWERFEATP
jgi:hypothetical protein